MRRKIFFIAFVIACCAYISYSIAHYVYCCDFPAFYRVAKIVLDPSMPITAIYELDDPTNRYNIPDLFMVYRYSVPVAYLMVPLGFMSFFLSKAVFIFINIILSLVSLAIALRLGGAKGSWLFYPLALSVLFSPFMQNIRSAQTNGILLFLITVAIVMATKDRFYLCGGLIGFAALFKFFPIAIAMALGIKNWRIFVGCLIPVSLTVMLPCFKEWIASFTVLPFDSIYYAFPYRYIGAKWFAVYLLFVGLASAYFIYRNRHLKYAELASFAIPAMLIALPIMEPYYPMLLFFSYGYLLQEIKRRRPAIVLTGLSILALSIGSMTYGHIIIIFTGLLLALAAIIYTLIAASSSLQQHLLKFHIA